MSSMDAEEVPLINCHLCIRVELGWFPAQPDRVQIAEGRRAFLGIFLSSKGGFSNKGCGFRLN